MEIDKGSLIVPAGKVVVGARFEITGVESAPASINVVLSNGTTLTVGLSDHSGTTAYYSTKIQAGLTVTAATAVVSSNWSGQFRLACYTFQSGGGSGSSTQVVHVASDSLTVPEGKTVVGARFEITGVQSAPASINVVLSNGSTLTVALSEQVGTAAYYSTKIQAGLTVTTATAVVSSNWSGQFRLACYTFSGSGSGSSTQVIQVASDSLTVPAGKVVVGARFEITGVHTAPASINVQLSNGTTLTVALSEQVGTTAFYSTKIQAGLSVTTATAVVASNWSGQFRLTCYTFQSGTGSGSTTQVIHVAPGSLSIPAGKVVVGARFEITGVHTAPASINVQLSNGTTLTVALTEQVGTTAFYSTKIQAGLTITTATAVVASNWSGQFQLLSYTFQSGTGTGSTTQVIQVALGSLTIPKGKVVIGARFEITGVHTAPGSINVQLSNGTTLTVALSEQVGTTAFYSTKIQAGLSVTTATAVVASNWSGQFQLLSYTFQSGTTTGGGTSGGTSGGTGSSGTTLGGSTSGGTGQSGSGSTAAGTAGTGAQLGTTAGGSGFPAGATGEAAAMDHRTPSWPLIALGIAGLLGAAALTVRSAHGKRVR